MALFLIKSLPRWGRQRGGGFAASKESQPRLAALGSPFQGKGLAWSLPVSSFRAKARNLFRSRSSRRCGDSGIPETKPSPRGEGAPKGRIGQKRYEKERGNASQVRRLREYPIHRWRGPPSPMGKAKRRRLRRKKKANPASLRSAAPSKGRGSRGLSLLPLEGGAPKGRRLGEDSGISAPKPSPRGEGGERSEPDRVLAG